MERIDAFVDGYNLIMGAAVAVLSTIFGCYWYLFMGFLLLNVLDWVTGWYKARKHKQESSKEGLAGLLKKLGYWVIILVAFMLADLFIDLGKDILNVNLSFLEFIGWFTLSSLIVNEVRSILENLVACGYRVPIVLMQGLKLTEKLINDKTIRGTDTEMKNEDVK